MTTITERLAGVDWKRVAADLDMQGWATTGVLLTPPEREALIAAYGNDDLFRSTVVMARHGFGRGEYRYFRYDLPDLIGELREGLYGQLVDTANAWRQRIGGAEPFPDSYVDFLDRCHATGQTRPTPLLLRYGPGDYNCLHQDLYGDLSFPVQAAFLLSEREEFQGGEFVLTEQRPRMQSRVHVVPLTAGEAVIFAVNHRPVQGTRGSYRVTMRHGVSPVRSGGRHTLGIILHDAA